MPLLQYGPGTGTLTKLRFCSGFGSTLSSKDGNAMTGTILQACECISSYRRLDLVAAANDHFPPSAVLRVVRVGKFYCLLMACAGQRRGGGLGIPLWSRQGFNTCILPCLSTTWGYWETSLVRLCTVVDCVPTEAFLLPILRFHRLVRRFFDLLKAFPISCGHYGCGAHNYQAQP